MHPAKTPFVCLLGLCLFSSSGALGVRADVVQVPKQLPAGGTYVDKSGTKYAWSITDAHTLIWDGHPYLPVGGSFVAGSLISDAASSWDADVATLNELKSHGISDIIVVPVGSLTDASPVRLQRLFDYLDTHDFHYGISFGKGIPDPLTGTVVKPASYKGHADQALTASWQTPFADSGLMILAEVASGHSEVVKFSTTSITDGSITANVEAPATSGKVIPYLYPHKSIPSGTPGTIPDIWHGYDGYRDRLLSLFAQVKPGKGLRFFLDPLGARLSLSDETDFLIPDSRQFLLEWESYIRTTYPNIEEAYRAWGLEESTALTAGEMAQLRPLWSNDAVIPYFYDPRRNKMMRLGDALQTKWWYDFISCRTRSIEYYMNGVANVLKKQVADVPVVFNWTMNHQIFINHSKSGGFDGLGIIANQRSTRLINRIALPAMSAADQSAKRLWCIETATMNEADLDASAGSNASGAIPFTTQGTLTGEISDLRRAGLKGFFAGCFSPAAAKSTATNWLGSANAVNWLHEVSTGIVSDSRAADQIALFLPFPAATPGPALIGAIGNTGVSWIPRLENGTVLDAWPAISGYTMSLSPGKPAETVMVSLQGKRKITFVAADPKTISVRTVTGTAVPIDITKKNIFSVNFPDKNPLIFTTGDQPQMAIIDAADDAIKQLRKLYELSKSVKAQDSESARVSIQEAELEYLKNQFGLANSAARAGIDRLLQDTSAYIWMEGENYSVSTFDDTPSLAGASQNSYLRVSNYNNPPQEYAVHYPFNVVTPGKYNIWLAATPPAADVSPFQWTLKENQRRDPIDPNPHGPLYASDKFGWILLGTALLDSGPNLLAIYVTGRAPATGRYAFGIDAMFISTGSDPPSGRVMPLPIDPASFSKNPTNPPKR